VRPLTARLATVVDACVLLQESAIAMGRVKFEQLQTRHDMYVREQVENRSRMLAEQGRLAQVRFAVAVSHTVSHTVVLML
jgi:hypothetical protein